jgi:RNA-directed DNA polymerase
MKRTSNLEDISTKLMRIAELAKEAPDMAFKTLAHHIDINWLHEAHRRTRKDGAPGVDGRTASQYAESLEENLTNMLNRAKSGSYRAPAVRRVNIPKGKGKETRPIGIPTYEDKVLQRAVVMVLNAVYEQDFLDCSYGFRPGRSAHQAVEDLRTAMMEMHGGWVLELDIRKFFDSMDHRHLREILRQRVLDGVLLRLIGKWLKAGVLEDGAVTYSKLGTPQGGVISPLLANVYLHEVLDTWFARDVQPRMKGRAHMVRYADDAVMVFSNEDDARRVLDVLPKRFAKYALRLHPDKTRLMKFHRPPKSSSPKGGGKMSRPGSFDFLGFNHHWERSRKGNWVIRQSTARDRLNRAIVGVNEWCRKHMHDELSEQWKILSAKLRGHYGYYGVTGNYRALRRFRSRMVFLWRKWLNRRSNRAHVTWTKMVIYLERFPLPMPRIVHSYILG